MTSRPWFLFQIPLPPGVVASRCYVPADTEAEAREKLAKNSYKGAPVHEWPCLGSRWASRERLFVRNSGAAAPVSEVDWDSLDRFDELHAADLAEFGSYSM